MMHPYKMLSVVETAVTMTVAVIVTAVIPVSLMSGMVSSFVSCVYLDGVLVMTVFIESVTSSNCDHAKLVNIEGKIGSISGRCNIGVYSFYSGFLFCSVIVEEDVYVNAQSSSAAYNGAGDRATGKQAESLADEVD